MPGVDRLSVAEAARAAEQAQRLGIPAIALFPHIDSVAKDRVGTEATNPNGLVCNAVRAMKKAAPGVGLMVDVALDPFTDHGHDGVLEGDAIVNDESVKRLVEQALVQAEAGADIVAPVRHDGRARRRDPRRAGDRGQARHADHVVRGEIRVGVLWPLSRGDRLGQGVARRQEDLPDGSGQQRRGAEGSGARHCRRRRHA